MFSVTVYTCSVILFDCHCNILLPVNLGVLNMNHVKWETEQIHIVGHM